MVKAIWTANYQWPNSAHVSYEFYSVWWPPEFGPMLVKMRGQAPLAWDLSGGAAVHNPRKRLFTNHADAGGNVLFADGHGEWQPATDWERENWPRPAGRFYAPGEVLLRP
jgi:prepilin-type processing-associated H-X9-DG protein